jgi:hypothetical protein
MHLYTLNRCFPAHGLILVREVTTLSYLPQNKSIFKVDLPGNFEGQSRD